MEFRTKLDFTTRQVSQKQKTNSVLSGGTTFGLPYSALTKGPNLLTIVSGIQYTNLVSSFSGNSATTIYNWYDSNMNIGNSSLSARTPSNSGTTQYVDNAFSASSTGITVDGNVFALSYTGLSFDVTPLTFNDLGSGNYSGTVITQYLTYLTADPLDFSGRTIWVDVSGITRTDRLIVTNTPQIGSVLTCINSEGLASWQSASGLTALTSVWSADTGSPSAVLSNSGGRATNQYSVAGGSASIASGFSSSAFGTLVIAGGDNSFAAGNGAKAMGYSSIALGNGALATNQYSMATGIATLASGYASYTQGLSTIAAGAHSFAGGFNTIASGQTSFVYGDNSHVTGDYSVVLGRNITGASNDYVYVPSLNIKTIGSSAFVNDIRIDANGNLTTNTSDVRMKENIQPICNALNTIKNLKGVTYQWKDKESGGNAIRLGFIAQDVLEVESKLVFENKNDGYLGIHIDGVIPILVEAIKELSSGTTQLNSVLETQTIIAEDNNIELNFNGTVESAVGGGIIVINGLGDGLNSEFIIDKNGNWTINSCLIPKSFITPKYTPSSSSDTYGLIGETTRDEDYLYVKGNNGWKRIKLENF
jgi:hypothetical protein